MPGDDRDGDETDQMVAAGQGEALKAMEKSIPMGRVGQPEEIGFWR